MNKLELLAETSLFQDLSDTALQLIAGIAKEYSFGQGAVVAYQRDAADSLYIVKEGRLFARTLDENGVVRESRSYLPGQHFNDLWLFVPGVHSATVKGTEDGRLLIIRSADFINLLKRYPGVITELAPDQNEDGQAIGLSDSAWNEARKLLITQKTRSSSAAAMLPEERIEYFARRSVWFLLLEFMLPFFLLLVAMLIFTFVPADASWQLTIKVGGTLLVALLAILIGIIQLIDWREDYFLITNKHLTHHEFDLRRFRIHLVKVPISMVQTVEVLKPSLVATLLNIGTAQVTTAAVAGRILFDNIDDPVLVKDTLDRLTSQHRTFAGAQTQAVMRQSIENHFGVKPELARADDESEFSQPQPTSRRREGLWTRLKKQFGWRVVDGKSVIYRKSLFVLFGRIALPLLVFIGLILLTFLGDYLSFDGPILTVLLGIAGLVNLVWFIWQMEDWRNDIFQLTDRFVIDIDRKPFGFGESRKQAALSNIQNVDAVRPGFFATIFNFGLVSVDTAGAKADIVFEYVPNPELVQSDIFQRLDDYRQKQRLSEEGTRREEYAMLLDVYRQAMEQDRIPNRTPRGLDET